jgi:hypothetical protein
VGLGGRLLGDFGGVEVEGFFRFLLGVFLVDFSVYVFFILVRLRGTLLFFLLFGFVLDSVFLFFFLFVFIIFEVFLQLNCV